MRFEELIHLLREKFSKDQVSAILAAILYDEYLKTAVSELNQEQLQQFGLLQDWSPLKIFLFQEGFKKLSNELETSVLLKEISAQLYDKVKNNSSFLDHSREYDSLKRAGYLALMIREHLLEKQSCSLELKNLPKSIQRLVFACLLPFLEGQSQYRESFFHDVVSMDLDNEVVEAYLCNPFDQDNINSLGELMIQLSHDCRIMDLKKIYQSGFTKFAQELALFLIREQERGSIGERQSKEDAASDINTLRYKATLSFYSGDISAVNKYHKQINKKIARLHDENQAQISSIISHDFFCERAKIKTRSQGEGEQSEYSENNSIGHQTQGIKLEQVQRWLLPDAEGGKDGSLSPNDLLQKIISVCDENPQKLLSLPLYFWSPVDLINVFEPSGLMDGVKIFAQKLINIFPNDAELRMKFAQILWGLGDEDDALEQTIISRNMLPTNENKELLAHLFYEKRRWQDLIFLYREDETISRGDDELNKKYLQALIHTSDIELAASLIKEEDFIIGEFDKDLFNVDLFLKSKQLDQADQIIKKYLNSSMKEPVLYSKWMELVEMKGEISQIEPILLEGLSYFPQNATLISKLGKYYFDQGQIEKAINVVKNLNVYPGTDKSSLCLLFDRMVVAGFSSEAFAIIKKAYAIWPLNGEILYRYCYSLVELEYHQSELDQLFAIHEDKFIGKPNREFLFLIYKLGGKPSSFPLEVVSKGELNLEDFTHKLFEPSEKPNNLLSQMIKAEVYRTQGETEKAFEVYREILSIPQLDQREELWRVQAGLANVCLDIGQLDTAITLIKEASRKKPNFLPLESILIKALLKKSLKSEAFHRAKEVFGSHPQEKKYLYWFTNQALILGKVEAGFHAFEQNYEIHKNDIEYVIKFARYCQNINNIQKALELINELRKVQKLSPAQVWQIIPLLVESDSLSDISVFLSKIDDETYQSSSPVAVLNAGIYYRQGNFQKSLETIQSIAGVKVFQNNFIQEFLEAYLYEKCEEKQKALLCYSQIFSDFDCAVFSSTEIGDDVVFKALPADWLEFLNKPLNGIFRMVNLVFQLGEWQYLPSIIAFTKNKMHEEEMAAYLELHLALINQDSDIPDNILESYSVLDGNNLIIEDHNQEIVTALFGALAEYLLARNEEIGAGLVISKGLSYANYHNRLLFAQSRLLKRNGSLTEAQKVFQSGFEQLLKNILQVENDKKGTANSIIYQIDHYPYWAYAAALELRDWDAVRKLLETTCKYSLDEPLTVFHILRSYCLFLLENKLVKQLGCNPMVDPFSSFNTNILANVKTIAQKFPAWEDELMSWKAKVEWLQSGEVDSIQDLPENTENAAFLIFQYLSEGKNKEAANLITEYGDQADVAIIAALETPEEYYSVALSALQASLKQDQKNPYVYIALYHLAAKMKDQNLAMSAITNAIALKPDECQWFYWLAKLEKERGDIYAFYQHMDDALQGGLNTSEALEELIQEMINQKQYDRAIKLFEKYQRNMQLQPEILQQIAFAYLELGKYRKSLILSDKMAKLQPQDSYSQILKSELASRSGNLRKAEQFSDEALAKSAQDPQVIVQKAKIIAKIKGEQDALNFLMMAIENGIKHPIVIIEAAKFIAEVSGDEDARSFLEEKKKQGEKSAEVHRELGKYFQKVGNSKKALQEFHASLKIQNNQAEIHSRIGEIYKKQGNLDKSLYHMNLAVLLAPFEMQYYLLLAKIFLMRREPANAEMILEKARMVNGKDTEVLQKLAEVYKINKKYQLAESILHEVAHLKPNDENVRNMLGQFVLENIVEQKQARGVFA